MNKINSQNRFCYAANNAMWMMLEGWFPTKHNSHTQYRDGTIQNILLLTPFASFSTEGSLVSILIYFYKKM
jgi:hypothetical protein